jgi:hypothetical protein
MSTYTKFKLSGSTDGKPIKVVATATPGTLIHTAHATDLDEIWLWVANHGTSDVAITIQWGGTTSPDDYIVSAFNIPANSQPIPIALGLLLTNSLVVRAFATSANLLTVYGFVNRIT